MRLFTIIALLAAPIMCTGQQITTVAGGGFSVSNGILATTASTGTPQGVAVDSRGDIFFFDVANNLVREVNTAGIINTVAGNGTQELAIVGSIGDGGLATSAGFGPPGLFEGVAVDAAGNLYISDQNNKRVRKVNTSGIISTFAGGGSGGDGGLATNASFVAPGGVAVDSGGNVYIADISGGRVRKVNSAGIISTVAGGGTGGDGGLATSASLTAPYSVAVDGQGNLYIAESSVLAMRVRKVTPGGIISTVAGGANYGYAGDGGLATNALLFGIQGIAVDSAGNLYISDNGNDRVRKVDTSGIITTVAGNGHPGSSGDGGLASNAVIIPTGLALDSAGNLYIGAGNIRRIAFGTQAPGLYSSASSIYFSTSVKNAQTVTQVQMLTIGTLGPPISFKVSSATQSGSTWLNVSGISATTPMTIQVSAMAPVALAAGTYKGTITITPTTPGYAPITVPVSYVVNAAPPATPVVTDVQNGASFQSGFFGNSIWTVKGTNLASTTDNWNNSIVGGALPTSLDGVTVTFNNSPAYISYISPTQINLLTPNVQYTSGSVVVNNNGASSSGFLPLGASGVASPAFFLWPNNQAVATFQDYTYAVKPATFQGLTTVAAKPGDVIILWGTGFGPTTPATQDGAVVPSDKQYSASTLPTVTVNNVPATVYGAALAAGYAGLYQVAIQVPPSLGNGDWPIVATVGAVDGVKSPSGVFLSVHN